MKKLIIAWLLLCAFTTFSNGQSMKATAWTTNSTQAAALAGLGAPSTNYVNSATNDAVAFTKAATNDATAFAKGITNGPITVNGALSASSLTATGSITAGTLSSSTASVTTVNVTNFNIVNPFDISKGTNLSFSSLNPGPAVNDLDYTWYATGYILITNNGVQYALVVGTNVVSTPPGVAAASFGASSASINAFYITNSASGPGSNQIHLLALTWYGAGGDKVVTTLTNNLGIAGTLLTNTSYGAGNFPVAYCYWTNSAMTYAAAIHNNSYIGEAGGLLLLTNARVATTPLYAYLTNNSALYTTVLTNIVSANRSKLALAFSGQNIYGAASSSATWNLGETSLGYVVSTNRLAFVGASKAGSLSVSNSVTWAAGAFADNSLDTLIIYAP